MPSLRSGIRLFKFLFRGVFEKLGVLKIIVYAPKLLIYCLALLGFVQILLEHCRELVANPLAAQPR